MSAKYFLSNHAYVRETDGHAVFLDLKRNRYTAIDPVAVRELRALVRGWAPEDGGNVSTRSDNSAGDALPQPATNPHEDDASIGRLLLREGVLTEDARLGKAAAPIALDPVTDTIDNVRGAYPRITWQDAWRFVRAWMLISVMLRVLPLAWVVSRARRRKARQRPMSATFDAKKAHRLMTAYWILRPNFFDAKDACLRDSLTFVEFFSFYGMYPTLVFGVKMTPFAAHAWVQEGAMVLNDYIPHVSRYAPILAV